MLPNFYLPDFCGPTFHHPTLCHWPYVPQGTTFGARDTKEEDLAGALVIAVYRRCPRSWMGRGLGQAIIFRPTVRSPAICPASLKAQYCIQVFAICPIPLKLPDSCRPNFYRPDLESNSSPFVPYHSSYPILAAQFLPPNSYRSNNNNSKMNTTSGSIGVEERPRRSTRERSAVEKFGDEYLPQVPVTPKKQKPMRLAQAKNANALAVELRIKRASLPHPQFSKYLYTWKIKIPPWKFF